MFDIGFSELIVIALVALIVIGPERLPRVARTVGALLGRAQRYVNDVKADIQREVDLDELKNLKTTFEDAAKSAQDSMREVEKELQATGESLNRSIEGDAQAAAPAAEQAPALAEQVPAAAEPAPATAEAPAASAQLDLGLDGGKPAPDTAPAHRT